MRLSIEEKYKNKILSLISALAPKAKVYLFGSRARETHGQWSDIDLALDAGHALDRSILGELNDIMVVTNLPYKVDIVDLYQVSEDMRQAILQEKVIWKE